MYNDTEEICNIEKMDAINRIFREMDYFDINMIELLLFRIEGKRSQIDDLIESFILKNFKENSSIIDDRDVLVAAVAVADQLAAVDRPLVVDRLLESIEQKSGMCRARHTPALDIAGVDVDPEVDIDERAQVAT